MTPRAIAFLLASTPLVLLCMGSIACRQDPAAAAGAFVANGDRYLEGRRYKAAILEYRNALEHQPDAEAIHRKLAAAYDRAGEPQKALASLAKVVALVENDSDANLRVSQALVAARRFEEARRLATRVLPGDACYAEALTVVATASAALGEPKAGDAALAKAFVIDPHSRAAHLVKASWQVRDGEFDDARRTLQALVQHHPRASDAWLAIGALDWQTGATAATEPSLRRALHLSTDKAAIHRVLASYFISVGRAPDAETHLRAVAEEGPTDRLRLAEYYGGVGRLDDAEREASVPIERKKGGGAARLLRAKIRYAQKRRADAEQDLTAALQDRKVEPDAGLLKSRVLLSDGKLDAALQQARTVAEDHPKRADASYAVAVAAMQKRDWAQATEWLERMRYLTDRPAAVDLQLAQVALAAGRVSDAVRHARRAATDLPAPETHALLARALGAAGDIQGASIALTDSRRRWPKAVALDLESGYLALQQNHPRAALTAFERAVRRAPDHAGVATVLGMVKQEGGDDRGARAAYERALARNPRDGIAANNLAWLFAASGRLDEALVLAQLAVEVLDRAPQTLDTLGWVHHRAGRHEDAIRSFQAALEKQPNNPTYLQHLGTAFLRAGHRNQAWDSLERALRVAPSFRDAATVRKMLAEMR